MPWPTTDGMTDGRQTFIRIFSHPFGVIRPKLANSIYLSPLLISSFCKWNRCENYSIWHAWLVLDDVDDWRLPILIVALLCHSIAQYAHAPAICLPIEQTPFGWDIFQQDIYDAISESNWLWPHFLLSSRMPVWKYLAETWMKTFKTENKKTREWMKIVHFLQFQNEILAANRMFFIQSFINIRMFQTIFIHFSSTTFPHGLKQRIGFRAISILITIRYHHRDYVFASAARQTNDFNAMTRRRAMLRVCDDPIVCRAFQWPH